MSPEEVKRWACAINQPERYAVKDLTDKPYGAFVCTNRDCAYGANKVKVDSRCPFCGALIVRREALRPIKVEKGDWEILNDQNN